MAQFGNIAMIILFIIAVAIVLYILFKPKKRIEASFEARDFYSIPNLISEVERAIRDVQTIDLEDLGLNEVETKKRIRQKSILRDALRTCCLGNSGKRQYVKDYIRSILQGELKLNEETISYAVAFERMETEDIYVLFEAVYLLLEKSSPGRVFGTLCSVYFSLEQERNDGTYYEITEEEAREKFLSIVAANGGFDYPERLELVTQLIYAKLYGLDVADSLIYDNSIDGCSGGIGGFSRGSYEFLEEMICQGETKNNSYDILYVMYQGKQIRVSFLSFGTLEHLMRVVRNIYRYDTPYMLTAQNGYVFASRQDNTRITVARPPVSASWAFFLRKFRSSRFELSTLVTGEGKELAIGLLKLLIQGEENMTISGNPAAGKTTLLKALVPYIDPRLAIRVAETVFETWFNELLPHRNIQMMQERGEARLESIINSFRRMDTDVTILGELLEPRLAGAFLELTQAGGRQSLCTLHHATVEKLVEYLRNALMVYYDLHDPKIAEQQVIQAIQFDVHLIRGADGNRYIERITELVPQELPVYHAGMTIEEGTLNYFKFSAQMATYKTYQAVDILRYDARQHRYRLVHDLSQQAYARMKGTMSSSQYTVLMQWMKQHLTKTWEEEACS